jgi:hypothetical protein
MTPTIVCDNPRSRGNLCIYALSLDFFCVLLRRLVCRSFMSKEACTYSRLSWSLLYILLDEI